MLVLLGAPQLRRRCEATFLLYIPRSVSHTQVTPFRAPSEPKVTGTAASRHAEGHAILRKSIAASEGEVTGTVRWSAQQVTPF